MDDVFRDLRPPEGGLARLRTRIRRRPVPAGWWLVLAAVLAAVWVGRPRPEGLPIDAGLLGLMGPASRGLWSPVDDRAIRPIAEAPGVRMYRVTGELVAP